MEEKTARISISLLEGKFEISGSEEFVSKQIENFKALIEKSFDKPLPKRKTPLESSKHIEIVNQAPVSTDEPNGGLHDKYSDIFVVDEDNIRIITDIPGDNAFSKTFNAALIYAFAKKQMGVEETSVEEVRSVCQNHGFLDNPNFSKAIKKGDPKFYLDKGKNKSRMIKLTRPGEKKAEELIQSILSDA